MIFTIPGSPAGPSPIEAFFMQNRAKIYEGLKHLHSTLKLYEEEKNTRLAIISENLDRDYKKLEEQYKEIYDHTEGDETWKRTVALHESGMYDFEGLYEHQEDMLNEDLQETRDRFNKAAFMQFYSLLESDLRRLCHILKDIKGTRISIGNFNAPNYMTGIFNYLDLVIELPVDTFDDFKRRIAFFQYVRNRLAHNGGEFEPEQKENNGPDTNGDANGKEENGLNIDSVIAAFPGDLAIVKDQLTGQRVLMIEKPDFVEKGFQLLAEISQKLFILVNEKFNYLILKERLEKLFKFKFPDCIVTVLEAKKIKKALCFKIKVEDRSQKQVVFGMSLLITPSDDTTIITLNQFDDDNALKNDLDEFLTILQGKVIDLGRFTFTGFKDPDPRLKVELKVYPLM